MLHKLWCSAVYHTSTNFAVHQIALQLKGNTGNTQPNVQYFFSNADGKLRLFVFIFLSFLFFFLFFNFCPLYRTDNSEKKKKNHQDFLFSAYQSPRENWTKALLYLRNLTKIFCKNTGNLQLKMTDHGMLCKSPFGYMAHQYKFLFKISKTTNQIYSGEKNGGKNQTYGTVL